MQAVLITLAFTLGIVGLSYLSFVFFESFKKIGDAPSNPVNKENQNEDDDEEVNEPSFFVSTSFITSKIILGAYVISTNLAFTYKEEMKLDSDVDFQPFMTGKVIGILDEGQKMVVIQIYPKRKKFIFKSQIEHFTPFVYLDELENSNFF